jgi:hypothetical protein
VTELIRERHQDHCAQARLHVFFRLVFGQAFENFLELGLENLNASVIGISRNFIPRLRASARASSMLPRDEYGLGMETPVTFSAPNASAAMTAVTAESTPPLKPTTTEWKLHLRQ